MTIEELQKKYNSYKKKSHDNLGIGHFYERQIRYLYETKGWRVEPYGILKGKSDLGRDLICTKKKQVLIIQAKNWSVKNKKIIYPKHLMQLAGSILHYINQNPKHKIPTGVFITTAKFHDDTKKVAKALNIQHRNIKLDKNYPMIKCNINRKGKRLFFFPFDKLYDNVHIDIKNGEFYTDKISECIKKGFKYVG